MNPSFDERIKNLVEAQAPPIGLDEVTGSAPADGAPDNRPPRTRRLLLAAAGILVMAGSVVLLVNRNGESRVQTDEPQHTPASSAPGRDEPGSPTSIYNGSRLPVPWETLPPPPLAPREGATVAGSDRWVLVWGGTGEDGVALRDGAILDLTSKTWASLPPESAVNGAVPATIGANAVWADDRFLLVGGTTEGRVQSGDVAALDPTDPQPAWQTTGTITESVGMWSAVAWDGNRMILSGGSASEDGGWWANTVYFDPGTGITTSGPEAPWPIAGDPYMTGMQVGTAVATNKGELVAAQLSLAGSRVEGGKVPDGGRGELELATLGPDGWVVNKPIDLGPISVVPDPPTIAVSNDGRTALIGADLDNDTAIVVDRTSNTVVAQQPIRDLGCDGPPHIGAAGTYWLVNRCKVWEILNESGEPQVGTAPEFRPGVGMLVQAGHRLVALDFGSTKANPNAEPSDPKTVIWNPNR